MGQPSMCWPSGSTPRGSIEGARSFHDCLRVRCTTGVRVVQTSVAERIRNLFDVVRSKLGGWLRHALSHKDISRCGMHLGKWLRVSQQDICAEFHASHGCEKK